MMRTRFAPSPTGALHLGNARIAVFNWLLARHHGGSFILRVEDTDTERNVEGSLESILEDLRWLGLDWDEGPEVGGAVGPYRQRERGHLHLDRAERLLEEGLAYPCTCPAPAEGETGGGCVADCRERDPGDALERWRRLGATSAGAAVRFRVPEGAIEVEDRFRGAVVFPADQVRDFVILRADGRPTYNFAVVVDDLLMGITHVIRGAGHLSNTPKHQLLFRALGGPVPVFAHLPTVLAPDGGKLSKRGGAPGLDRLRREGYHPDGVINYLSLLGWAPEGEREVLTRAELVQSIELDRVGASDTMYDPEKLRWMSAQHIEGMSDEAVGGAIAPFLEEAGMHFPEDRLPRVVRAIRTRLSTFGEAPEHVGLLYPSEDAARGALRRLGEEPGALELIDAVRTSLSEAATWDAESVGRAIREQGKALGRRGAGLFRPLRLALVGAEEGPDLGKTMDALGREESLSRLETASRALRPPSGSE